jgi:hypothetical protein
MVNPQRVLDFRLAVQVTASTVRQTDDRRRDIVERDRVV